MTRPLSISLGFGMALLVASTAQARQVPACLEVTRVGMIKEVVPCAGEAFAPNVTFAVAFPSRRTGFCPPGTHQGGIEYTTYPAQHDCLPGPAEATWAELAQVDQTNLNLVARFDDGSACVSWLPGFYACAGKP